MSNYSCNKCKGGIKGIRLVSNVASLPSIIRKRYSQEFCRVLSIPEDKNISGEFLTNFTYLCEHCDINLEQINGLISKLDRVQVIVSEARHQIELILQTSLFDLKDHNPKITAAYSVNNNGTPMIPVVANEEVDESMPKLTKRKLSKKERRKRKKEVKKLYGGRGVENIEVEVSPYLFHQDANGTSEDRDVKPFVNASDRPLIKIKDLNQVLQISKDDEESGEGGEDEKVTLIVPKRTLRSSTRPSYSKPSLTLSRKAKRRRNSQDASSNSESSYSESESDSESSTSSDSEISSKVAKKAFTCSICRAGYQRMPNFLNHMKTHEDEKKTNGESEENDGPPVIDKEVESPNKEPEPTPKATPTPSKKSKLEQVVKKLKRGRPPKVAKETEETPKEPEPKPTEDKNEKKETAVVPASGHQRLTRRQMKMMGIALEAEQLQPKLSPKKKMRKSKVDEKEVESPKEAEKEKETENVENDEGDLVIDEAEQKEKQKEIPPIKVTEKSKREKKKEIAVADYTSDNESVKSPSLITAAIASLEDDLGESEGEPEGALDLSM